MSSNKVLKTCCILQVLDMVQFVDLIGYDLNLKFRKQSNIMLGTTALRIQGIHVRLAMLNMDVFENTLLLLGHRRHFTNYFYFFWYTKETHGFRNGRIKKE